MMGKRFFDLALSCLALIFLSPVWIFASVLIKHAFSDPILTKSTRVGKGGARFDLYQFRISDNFPPALFYVRRLPELLNILKGEMSFVGPTPASPAEVERFKADFEVILRVRPGMFGCTPVSLETKPTLPARIKYEKGYAQGRSCYLDLKILFTHFVTRFFSLPLPLYKGKDAKKNSVKACIFDARGKMIFATHLTAALLCHYAAFWLRFDGKIPPSTFNLYLKSAPLAAIVQMGFLYCFGVSRGLWRYAGLRDFLNIGWSVTASAAVLWGMILMLPWQGYPRSIYFINALLLLLVLSALRCSKRVYSVLTQTDIGANRVLIIGAGNAGEMIARDMRRDRRHYCKPVGFIDDDPKKRSKIIHNISVMGNCGELAQAVSKARPDEILIAIPSGTPGEIKKIIQRCKSLKLPIKTLPNLSAILEGKAAVTDIRPLDIEDLLGRAEIKIEDPDIAAKIKGKRVLITGAGGSIGSELCRQVASFSPKALTLVERHENNLYQIELDLRRRFPGLSLNPVMADILDAEKMDTIFSASLPEMVFHAAAYKHVPMMEKNPLEAIRNNILGTYRVLTSSDRFGASEFVLISTDKAVAPSSIMGATKRVAEMMVRYFDAKSQTRLVSVRFGNVLESAGSVVPLFREQIKNGGPVRVTHPEVKRYFISIQEAVQLVLHASLLGQGGEVFVLDMGKEVKVMDLAKTMIILSGFSPGAEIPIEIIGLRPGEKLSEGLFEEGEEVIQTPHQKIRLAKNKDDLCDVPKFIQWFEKMNHHTRLSEIQTALKAMIPTYEHGALETERFPAQTPDLSSPTKKIIPVTLKT
ncbi:MAG: polysaccharide biosynthesis protein [Nitrospiria bacterium]